jgi:hypothetical protein
MSGKMNFKARKIHTDTTVSAARRSKHGGIISRLFSQCSR